MNTLKIEILPGIGLNGIHFGASKKDVESILGQPDEKDIIEDAEDEMLDTATVYHYWDKYISVFFSGPDQDELVAFETDHLDAILFSSKVFKLSEKQLTVLLKENNIFEFDEDTEPWGEKRISSPELGIDFYFEDEKLGTINWSAWYDQNGKLILPE
ncbi:MAG: hypothetical protein A2X11_02290 [Bacteroidetes bacterium GWE2_42_24]|nr:MAG: hypothetical protein A2X11_02290 [Bacteroidetes bacterium GWE2_42_24]OFY25419.1 MAG: hypothetical protein A2X09_03025 [Bacteroidetes bacterium GWF2_43_11]PKP25590.1 MAG: hypothetical protein CVU06_04050 [Bacteroidetes bacterium HGW-Bacteroidetes-22]